MAKNLTTDKHLDTHLKPLKSGEELSSLELTTYGNGARVNGDLLVTGDLQVDGAEKNIDDTTKLPLAGGTMTGDIAATGDFKIDCTGDITLDADDGTINLHDGGTAFCSIDIPNKRITFLGEGLTNYIRIETTTNGASIISTVDADGTDGDLALDVDGDLTLNSTTGVFIAEKAGTEFSADNSAYAGMILGYTDIGLDEVHVTLSLTTSFVVPTDEFSVSFVAPPSGNVLIEWQIQFGTGSSGAGILVADLSTTNATAGYTQLEDINEKVFSDNNARNDVETTNGSWTLTGLTAGTAYERWIAFKSISTTGSPYIQWGANGAGRYPDFIMKATALPETIVT